jgi:bifunctional non-homologous end joining protein LigD
MSNDVLISKVKITNGDKIIFDKPRITKLDVIKYYAEVSERMLPYVKDRVLSIIRCPKGICEACFFKKHPDAYMKGVKPVSVPSSDGADEYFYITDALGLLCEAQMGTVEFHTWGSKVKKMEKPDVMVFDLDPDAGMPLETVREGVLDMKNVLEELGLKSYLKTSGGKGYHVVVPFKSSPSWEVFHDFSKNIAVFMENKWSDKYTSNVRKTARKGRIFIDWIRNGRGATAVAPYSLRARSGAPVSMPISWEELNDVAPNAVDIFEAVKRLKKPDPWQGFYETNQRIK